MSQPPKRQPRELLNKVCGHCYQFCLTAGLKGPQNEAAHAAYFDAFRLWWTAPPETRPAA